MVDPLNLAGVIGTWVAVALALIALIAIVGPILVLRQIRSERYQAIDGVDSKDSGYITHGLRITPGTRLFRKGNVPNFELAPCADHKTPHFHAPDFKKIKSLSSRTGWVNFASIIDAYTDSLQHGDFLEIKDKATALKVNRFWLLAFGLLGRYGERQDGGLAIVSRNSRRLLIDEDLVIDGYTENDSRAADRLANKLHGLTGILTWEKDLDTSEDRVRFQLHQVSDRTDVGLDPSPIQELFWLSLGHLPLIQGANSRVFDMGVIRKRDRSRTVERNSRVVVQSTIEQFELRDPVDENVTMWASAMGVDFSNVWQLQTINEDGHYTAAEALEKGLRKFYPDHLHDFKFLRQNDVHCVALAILSLTISPVGFLWDRTRYLDSNWFTKIDNEGQIADWVTWLQDQAALCEFSESDSAALGEFAALYASAAHEIGVENDHGFARRRFYFDSSWPKYNSSHSRQVGLVLFNVDMLLRKRKWQLPDRVRSLVEIMALTNRTFITLLLSITDSRNEGASACTVTVNTLDSSITIRCNTSVFTDSFDYDLLYPDDPEKHHIHSRTYETQVEVLLCAIRAFVRMDTLLNSIDSAPLLQMIKDLGEVVWVQADTRNFVGGRQSRLNAQARELQADTVREVANTLLRMEISLQDQSTALQRASRHVQFDELGTPRHSAASEIFVRDRFSQFRPDARGAVFVDNTYLQRCLAKCMNGIEDTQLEYSAAITAIKVHLCLYPQAVVEKYLRLCETTVELWASWSMEALRDFLDLISSANATVGEANAATDVFLRHLRSSISQMRLKTDIKKTRSRKLNLTRSRSLEALGEPQVDRLKLPRRSLSVDSNLDLEFSIRRIVRNIPLMRDTVRNRWAIDLELWER